MLSKNGHYWILFTIHGINVGLSMALATIFNQVITPYGYTNAQSGQLTAVSFFAGTLGCCKLLKVQTLERSMRLEYFYINLSANPHSTIFFIAVAGPVLDMTKQHKLFLRLMAPLTLATYVGFIFIGKYGMRSPCKHDQTSNMSISQSKRSPLLLSCSHVL